MSAEIVIRAGCVEDLSAVVALERGVEAPHWAEVEYAGMVDGHKGGAVRCLLVAVRGDEVAGFAVGKVIRTAGLGELESVAVASEARRLGVGRALCDSVIRWCRDEGADVVELEVRSANVAALRLYEGLGFQEVGLRRGYYREPVDDAVLMRRELPKQQPGMAATDVEDGG